MNIRLQIDPEFRELIPPLKDEEFEQLEKNVLEEGIRDAIVTWNGIILDGHNRYKIAQKHNIPFVEMPMEFDNRSDAKEWMINNQLGRRNINNYQRSVLALQLKPVIAERAKENQLRTSDNRVRQISDRQEIDTKKIIARQANVSHDTIAKVEVIQRKAAPEVKKQLARGDISINKAYTNIVNREKKEQRRIEVQQAAKEYEPDDLVQIIHGDAIDVLRDLASESIDLIVVDPPYFGITKESWDNQWQSMKEYLEWCRTWMLRSFHLLKDTGNFYIWGSVGEKSDSIVRQKLLLDSLGFYFKDWITWSKRRGMGNRRGWLYTREECLWYVKNNESFNWNEEAQYSEEKSDFAQGFSGYELKSDYKRITNVWTDIPEFIGDKGTLHYTPKPIQAMERLIKAHTKEGDVVLDFFGGSGTTAVACKNLNRKCILVEKDLDSINETKRRLVDGI